MVGNRVSQCHVSPGERRLHCLLPTNFSLRVPRQPVSGCALFRQSHAISQSACLIEQSKSIAYSHTHVCVQKNRMVHQEQRQQQRQRHSRLNVSLSQHIANDLSGEQSSTDDCHKDIFACCCQPNEEEGEGEEVITDGCSISKTVVEPASQWW